MKKSELVQLIENIAKKILNESGYKPEDFVNPELKEYFVKGTAKYSGDQESYSYSYKLEIPYEEGDTENTVLHFLKTEYNIGEYEIASQPGQRFNHEYVDAVLRKRGDKKYWLLTISGRGGLDI